MQRSFSKGYYPHLKSFLLFFLATVAIVFFGQQEVFATTISEDGTTADYFTIDADDSIGTGETVTLKFGDTLGKHILFDIDSDSFEINDDVNIDGNILTLDADDSGGDITLIFGRTLNKYIQYDASETTFSINDTVTIEGTLNIADDIDATDADGTINLGRNSSTWESLSWNDTADRFEFTDSLYVGSDTIFNGNLDLSYNQLQKVLLEKKAVSPTCNTTYESRIYYNTAENQTYVCDGTSWIPLHSGAQGFTTVIKILPSSFSHYGDFDGKGGLESYGSEAIQEPGGPGLMTQYSLPKGYIATDTILYSTCTSCLVEVFECNVGITSCTEIGSGLPNATIDITDTVATDTNYLSIMVDKEETFGYEHIRGATITIEPVAP